MRWAWWVLALVVGLHAAILPPPWADPSINPCATQPGGWLKLYWPEDGQCYRIFQRGTPCPTTMELSPGPAGAQCKCPPGQVQLLNNSVCHQIHTRGPCGLGQYLAPQGDSPSERRGRCMDAVGCTVIGEVFWPNDERCYPEYTRGPCPIGQLLVNNNGSNFGECTCDSKGPLSRYFWPPTKSCHQFYTRGPCLEKGALFLPGPKCGCHPGLPNYHADTEQCYELGGPGPCKPGHIFQRTAQGQSAGCTCKADHVPWLDGHCYRAFTRGPCPIDQLLNAQGVCTDLPCPRGKLFFPRENTCFRVGVRGPCPRGQLVLFEQNVRTSFEGISYRGMCGCPGRETCTDSSTDSSARKSHPEISEEVKEVPASRINYSKAMLCETVEGVEVCHQLYTQGPCMSGEWLVPNRQSRARTKRRANKSRIPSSIGVYIGHRFNPAVAEPLQQEAPPAPRLFQEEGGEKRKGRCECRPGYSRVREGEGCRLPLIALAKFLNGEDYFK